MLKANSEFQQNRQMRTKSTNSRSFSCRIPGFEQPKFWLWENYFQFPYIDSLPNISSTQRKTEFLIQWEPMLGFFTAVKLFAERSGIDLVYVICLISEGLLFNRLTETERSLLLQIWLLHAIVADISPCGSSEFM
ncbi:uncharacterized protein MELLADRAFT_93521 [Melampsora larici-populina 98AG31]|uniref:Uncharacterized protein n=1 Tax=Melampsora larici-populina (strain 98AG31 / pathotype 3-4-7) TaxID=747676 RepID=F4RAQ2_MELLP|nr:uncharacterized protein MELLADRAFT_93521 [Melampsora larici-populina 98AG31]EGG10522.1 hypothetical protein MELLADRAFT_93521 [Melampsora larici-populina 98AG31]